MGVVKVWQLPTLGPHHGKNPQPNSGILWNRYHGPWAVRHLKSSRSFTIDFLRETTRWLRFVPATVWMARVLLLRTAPNLTSTFRTARPGSHQWLATRSFSFDGVAPNRGPALPVNLGVRVVPQQSAWVVERFGKFHKVQGIRCTQHVNAKSDGRSSTLASIS